jgi:hypothetical protein
VLVISQVILINHLNLRATPYVLLNQKRKNGFVPVRKISYWKSMFKIFISEYYVAAGTSITIDVVEQEGASGWLVRIGCHNDDLKNCDEFRRWNCVSICKLLTTESIEMCSPFGGLLFLESPDKNSNSITINIHRVVLTLSYNLSDPNRAEIWEYQQENAQGLWADIAGNYIVFNVPSTSVRELDSEQLDRALEFWDSVVLAHHNLAATEPKHRERVVCDEQPSVGYMRKIYLLYFTCNNR